MLLQLRDGKADIAVTIAELVAMLPSKTGSVRPPLTPTTGSGNTWSSLNGRIIIAVVNVTEDATGTTLSGNSTVRCTTTKYVLSFLDITPSSFKPGLTVSAYVRIPLTYLHYTAVRVVLLSADMNKFVVKPRDCLNRVCKHS